MASDKEILLAAVVVLERRAAILDVYEAAEMRELIDKLEAMAADEDDPSAEWREVPELEVRVQPPKPKPPKD